MRLILEIFKRAKFRILLVYLFCIVANTLWILEPYVLGKMIDGLMAKTYFWSIIFIIINLIFIGFGYFRRVLDTKVFSRLYNEVILQYINRNIDCTDTSKIVARTEMSRVITSFLEEAIPTYISVVYATLGSLIAIFLVSPISSIILLISLIPTYFLSKYFYEKNTKMTHINNSNNELHVEKIQTKNRNIIKNFFERRRKLLIMDSTLTAKNYMAFDFLGLLITFITLVFYISSASATAGDAVSFYGYLNKFIYGFGIISYCISSITQIQDVSKRIN
jgi:ABC-type multidrug transport system fused ATPase/permease subunit